MSRQPRVSLVTQWYSPEPLSLPVRIAEALAGRGWTVSALTGVPNFPNGRVYDGYSAWWPRRERLGGVAIHRTPLFPSHDSSSARRMLNYATWAASATALGRSTLSLADISLVYASPATAALPALAAQLSQGTPYALMVQDVWPDSIYATGFLGHGVMRRSTEPVAHALMRVLYRHASLIIVTSPGMRALLAERGVPAQGEKVRLVYNWADESKFRPRAPDHSWRQDAGVAPEDFVVMYAGNHGPAQGLAEAINAFGLLPSTSQAHLVLIGEGIEKSRLIEHARSVAPARVHFLPAFPADQMATVMAAGDVHLVSLGDNALFERTMPSKVQCILACGKPLLVSAAGDAAQAVKDAGAGVSVMPGRPDQLARAVTHLEALGVDRLRRLGANGLRYYQREMAESVGANRLSEALKATADSAKSPRGRGGDRVTRSGTRRWKVVA